MRVLLTLAALLLATPAQAAPGQRTYANPVDIDYRYNFEQDVDRISYRTGADPAIMRFKGAYYLFMTLADGYWRSTDLIHWDFIVPSKWPAQSVVAPAVWEDGERLYMMPSTTQRGPIYVTDDPASGKLEYLNRMTPPLPGAVRSGFEDGIKPGEVPPGPWDPALFRDDDGKWYMYWNSSNVFPLYAIELDAKDRLKYIGTPRPLFGLEPDRHGWERFGPDHSGGLPNGTAIRPFMEGAWMTKVNGRYYLQYGAPGTEYNVYANGTYVADHPMGPFRYAPYNPVAYKPGGFVEGAGHGSTFKDVYGNWWNTGTPWIGYNWTFERRIAMFPTRFADDGQMIVSTRFGDFPHWMPTSRITDLDSLFTGWMLLSYRKPAVASSTIGDYGAAAVTDENQRTFWVAGANKPGETLTVDLAGEKTVRAVQVNFADYRSDRFADAPDIYTAFTVEASRDGRMWTKVAETGADRRDRPNAYFELAKPVAARFIRYVHGHVGAANLAISDVRVFGSAPGKMPATPVAVRATRAKDQRDATVRWARVPGAVGYNVRWGVRPDRLTLTYQVFADRVAGGAQASLDLRALNVGVPYYVAVEAFDESGVSKLSRRVAVVGAR